MHPPSYYSTLLETAIKEIIPLSNPETEIVRKLFVQEQFRRNEVVLKEGELCRKLCFIARGILRFSLSVDCSDRTFVFRSEGAFCCDMESFLKKRPSKYTISAIGSTTLLTITYDSLQTLYEELTYGERFGRLTVEQLFMSVVNHLTSFYSETPGQRYTRFALEHKDLLQRIPQYHIASYIGVSPQALCRIKKKRLYGHL